ncbi:hypothetical protein OF83DRAFT_1292101 [Amylostereum chailletii]|nr:hypothetical protein OF83DRAFT_1292101 [Amylostereum chailletii]
MVIMNTDAEPDVAKLWALLTELMESTNSHRQYAAELHARANGVKGQAIHTQTGFVLRRFNLEKSKGMFRPSAPRKTGRYAVSNLELRYVTEEYDAELERMNASMSADNLSLQHDNKQLNALIKEYETTLETVMDQFRNRAHEVQENELSLIRTYETQLLARESASLAAALSASSATSASLTRLSVTFDMIRHAERRVLQMWPVG